MAAPERIYRTILVDTMDRLRDVSVQAERVYCRLALGKHSTRTGLIRYRMIDLSAECRLRHGEVDKALEELESNGFIMRAKSAPALYLLRFCSVFAPLSHDTRAAWMQDLDAFEHVDLALQARKEIEDRLTTGKPAVNHRKTGGQAQEQEQKQEQKHDDHAPAKQAPTQDPAQKFKPPTQDEATAFFATVGGNASMAEDFVLFYAGKGWLVGKSPMKDWTMAARRWAKGNGASGQPLAQLGIATAAPSSVPMGRLKDGTIAPLVHANGNILQANGYYAPAHLAVNPQEAIR